VDRKERTDGPESRLPKAPVGSVTIKNKWSTLDSSSVQTLLYLASPVPGLLPCHGVREGIPSFRTLC
jgi:hypothetical protein